VTSSSGADVGRPGESTVSILFGYRRMSTTE
jgi:hypothetical protein